jgi:hypothetical protein
MEKFLKLCVRIPIYKLSKKENNILDLNTE